MQYESPRYKTSQVITWKRSGLTDRRMMHGSSDNYKGLAFGGLLIRATEEKGWRQLKTPSQEQLYHLF